MAYSGKDHAAMLGRVEASIMGESALIDRESGRVFWEGAMSNTLYESLLPRLQRLGTEHAIAILLSGVMVFLLLGVLASCLRHIVPLSPEEYTAPSKFQGIFVAVLEWTIFKIPVVKNKAFIAVVVVLYLVESLSCDTRKFLANAISSPNELEQYIERLRDEHPVVTWKVCTFHHEIRPLLSPSWYIRRIQQLFKTKTPPAPLTSQSAKIHNPRPPLTKKVVSREATAEYRYSGCVDNTQAGVWKRADTTDLSTTAPFTKLVLTKLLVLANRSSREDYFKQQADFVTADGQGDEYVEFSTDIHLEGFKPKMLAERHLSTVRSTKLFRLRMFWLFTLLGLTVPFRLWFSRHCDYLRVIVVKETYADTPGYKRTTSLYPKWLQESGLESTKETTAKALKGNPRFRSFMEGLSLYSSESAQDTKEP